MLFMPKCPVCGGKTESIEPDSIDNSNMRFGHAIRMQTMMGHPHPLLKAMSVGLMVGRQIYKRVPGGGEKRCTRSGCGHTFR